LRVSERPVRSNPLRERMFTTPPKDSASMSAVGVLMTSTLSIDPEAMPLTSWERESGLAEA
jgi:hypothetical protein